MKYWVRVRKVKKMRNKIKRGLRKFLNSRFFLAVIMLIIGISLTVSAYEFQKLWTDYQEALTIWADYNSKKADPTVAQAEVEAGQEGNELDESSSPFSLGDVVSKVFFLESTNGKFVNCPEGQYNGYGYAQNKFVWNCYDTQEEVDILVASWFQDKWDQGYTVPESLCYYNKGIRTETCDYYKKFKSI